MTPRRFIALDGTFEMRDSFDDAPTVIVPRMRRGSMLFDDLTETDATEIALEQRRFVKRRFRDKLHRLEIVYVETP